MLRMITMLSFLLLVPAQASAGEPLEATMYKRPYCGCCDGHAAHLRANGYKVKVVQSGDLALIKKEHGVPQELEGCHTIVIGGYVVEGHVPASIITRMLPGAPGHTRHLTTGHA